MSRAAERVPAQPRPHRKRGSRPKPGSGPTRVIAVANQKGGVGKSTTAVSLGGALAEAGYRVLVVDLDPQGNASTGLGIGHGEREVTIYEVLAADAPMVAAVISTPVENLSVVPSTIDLAGAEIELVSQFSREQRLRKAMEPLLEEGFDFVFLDCPPSLGLLTVNALTAASEVLVPIQCEYYALEGLGQLLRNVKLVQQNVNPSLRLTGIVLTMYDSRTRLSEQVVGEVRRYFGDRVYRTVIPRSVRLSEAPGFGQPITVYDSRSRGAESYRELALEVVSKLPVDEPFPAFEELPVAVAPMPERRPASAPRPLLAEAEEEGEEGPRTGEELLGLVAQAAGTTVETTEAGGETVEATGEAAEEAEVSVEIVAEESGEAAGWIEMLEAQVAAESETIAPEGGTAEVGDRSSGAQGGGPSSVEGWGDTAASQAEAVEAGTPEPSAALEAAGSPQPDRAEAGPEVGKRRRRWMSFFRRGGRR